MEFEKRAFEYEPAADDSGFSRRQYLTYGGAITGVLGLGGYAVLRERAQPSVPGVPGAADAAAGITFADAEAVLRETLNSEREVALTHSDDVDAAATYYTRYLVKHGFHRNPPAEDVAEFVNGRWESTKMHLGADPGEQTPFERVSSATELGDYLAKGWLNSPARRLLLDDDFTTVGIDLHAGPTGDLYASLLLVR